MRQRAVSRSLKFDVKSWWEGRDPLRLDITATFLELGDATLRNLEFSHRDDVWVSYGEETVTESNLVEIRRRHPELVRVRTFPKPLKAKNGADWEWHVVGRRRTLKMRMQAKRLQRNGVLKVRHKVKSSGKQQRDLLIAGAPSAGMKAVYCIYCTEPQRKVWTQHTALPGYKSFQTGCLLVAAANVLPTTQRLEEIEDKCRPWHHLFAPAHCAALWCRHPQWKVIPSPIRIGDSHNRFAAMRAVFDGCYSCSGKRMKPVMDRDRLVFTMGFVRGSTQPRAMRIWRAIRSRRHRRGSPTVSGPISSATGSRRRPRRHDVPVGRRAGPDGLRAPAIHMAGRMIDTCYPFSRRFKHPLGIYRNFFGRKSRRKCPSTPIPQKAQVEQLSFSLFFPSKMLHDLLLHSR